MESPKIETIPSVRIRGSVPDPCRRVNDGRSAKQRLEETRGALSGARSDPPPPGAVTPPTVTRLGLSSHGHRRRRLPRGDGPESRQVAAPTAPSSEDGWPAADSLVRALAEMARGWVCTHGHREAFTILLAKGHLDREAAGRGGGGGKGRRVCPGGDAFVCGSRDEGSDDARRCVQSDSPPPSGTRRGWLRHARDPDAPRLSRPSTPSPTPLVQRIGNGLLSVLFFCVRCCVLVDPSPGAS